MKFRARFRQIQLNSSKFRDDLAKVLTRDIKIAATAWLNATVMSVIPIWSGASRATFLKLSRSVGFGLTITGIEARSSENPRALGPSVGFQQSEGKVNTDGARKGIVSFNYGTDLFHLVFNEYENANASPVAGRLFARLRDPGPYGFQDIGREAFEEFARVAVELPNPWKSPRIKLIRVGR